MQLLFLIIKRVELVDDIMCALANNGIKGGTVIDTMGMAKSISESNSIPMIGVLRSILSGEDPTQKGKMIMIAVNDDQVETAKKAIIEITGDLDKPNAGVLFGVPITFVEGIK